MFKLKNNDFNKVVHLVKSRNELSVLSVIKGTMPGEIYVNSTDNPTATLIKTCECNLIAGSSNDVNFNSNVSKALDFWDTLTPDSSEWIDLIPAIHKNPFVRKYKRRHYILSVDDFKECNNPIKDGFIIEKVDIDLLKQSCYENAEKLLEWIEEWGDDARFQKYGVGYFIHNGKVIVSWSLSDCSFDKKIAIGIHTDERYRKNGFGKVVASATVKDCFTKKYEKIDWLCVDTNLIWDSLYCYIKSNDVEKTISIMTSLEQRKINLDYTRFKNYIINLQDYGLCSNFRSQVWLDFPNKNIPC